MRHGVLSDAHIRNSCHEYHPKVSNNTKREITPTHSYPGIKQIYNHLPAQPGRLFDYITSLNRFVGGAPSRQPFGGLAVNEANPMELDELIDDFQRQEPEPEAEQEVQADAFADDQANERQAALNAFMADIYRPRNYQFMAQGEPIIGHVRRRPAERRGDRLDPPAQRRRPDVPEQLIGNVRPRPAGFDGDDPPAQRRRPDVP